MLNWLIDQVASNHSTDTAILTPSDASFPDSLTESNTPLGFPLAFNRCPYFDFPLSGLVVLLRAIRALQDVTWGN